MRTIRRAAALALLALSIPVVASAGDLVTIRVTGHGTPIVFLSGIGSPGSVWDDVVAELAPRCTCIVMSFAGFAGAAPAPAHDAEAVTAAVAREIDRGGWDKPVVVGHSYGGFLALSLAAAHPAMFRKVVIVDAYPFPMGQLQPAMTAEAARQQATAVRAALLKLTDDEFAQQQRAVAAMSVTDPARAEGVLAWALASDRASIADAQFAMLSSDLRSGIVRIAAPVLAIGTWRGREPFGFTHDRTAHQLDEQYAGVPEHRTVVNDTARHYVMLDEPSWLAATITEFVTR